MLSILLASVVVSSPQFQFGKKAYDEGRLLEAVQALNEAIEADASDGAAYGYRALAVTDLGDFKRALPDFEKAIELSPSSALLHYQFGDALLTAKQPDRAEQMLRRALELKPTHANAHYRLGDLLKAKGDREGAKAAYRANARYDEKGSGFHALGDLFLEDGEEAKALDSYRLDLERVPTCYDARINLATLLAQGGDSVAAEGHFEKSLALHPGDPRTLRGLGLARLASGNHEGAIAALYAAQKLAPKDEETSSALNSARWRYRLRVGWPLFFGGFLVGVGFMRTIYKKRKAL